MIWIKNHGVSGESDNLRVMLASELPDVIPHRDDPEAAQAVVRIRGWTGINLDVKLPDEAVQAAFSDALGDRVRWAIDEPADHDDYNDKSAELDALYDGSHPEIDR